MRQLFDVLALLADDGPDGKRWDEQVDRLRLRASLLRTRVSMLARSAADRAHAESPNTTGSFHLLGCRQSTLQKSLSQLASSNSKAPEAKSKMR